jgi:hypothetical protein
MKISEMKKLLNRLEERHGDLEICSESCGDLYSIKKIVYIPEWENFSKTEHEAAYFEIERVEGC